MKRTLSEWKNVQNAVLKRMIDAGRPIDEIMMAADGICLRWLVENSDLIKSASELWSLTNIQCDPPLSGGIYSRLREASGVDVIALDIAVMGK